MTARREDTSRKGDSSRPSIAHLTRVRADSSWHCSAMSMPTTSVAPPAPGIAAHRARAPTTRRQSADRACAACWPCSWSARLILLPPPSAGAGAALIAAGYLLAAVALTIWLRGGSASAIQWGWLGLYVDLLALSALCLIADQVRRHRAGPRSCCWAASSCSRCWPPPSCDVGVCVERRRPDRRVLRDRGRRQPGGERRTWASVVLRVLVLAGVGIAAIGLYPHPAVPGDRDPGAGRRPDRTCSPS